MSEPKFKAGQKVKYIGGQDEEGKKLFELKKKVPYTVWKSVTGNFNHGQDEAIYLKEVGEQCAFIYSMFELIVSED